MAILGTMDRPARSRWVALLLFSLLLNPLAAAMPCAMTMVGEPGPATAEQETTAEKADAMPCHQLANSTSESVVGKANQVATADEASAEVVLQPGDCGCDGCDGCGCAVGGSAALQMPNRLSNCGAQQQTLVIGETPNKPFRAPDTRYRPPIT